MGRLVLVIAVLVAGCGGATPSSAPTVGTPPPLLNETPPPSLATAEPTIAPSPTPSLEELATAYRACLKPYVATSEDLNNQFEKATTLKALKKVSAAFADSEGTVIDCLRAIPWTLDVEVDAKAMITALSTIQTTERAMSESKTYSEFNRWYKKWLDQSLAVAAAGNLLRGDIGLPQNG